MVRHGVTILIDTISETFHFHFDATHHSRHTRLVHRPMAGLGGLYTPEDGQRQRRLKRAMHISVILTELVKSCQESIDPAHGLIKGEISTAHHGRIEGGILSSVRRVDEQSHFR